MGSTHNQLLPPHLDRALEQHVVYKRRVICGEFQNWFHHHVFNIVHNSTSRLLGGRAGAVLLQGALGDHRRNVVVEGTGLTAASTCGESFKLTVFFRMHRWLFHAGASEGVVQVHVAVRAVVLLRRLLV